MPVAAEENLDEYLELYARLSSVSEINVNNS